MASDAPLVSTRFDAYYLSLLGLSKRN